MSLRSANHRYRPTPAGPTRGRPALLRLVLALLAGLMLAAGSGLPAAALDPIEITEDADRVDITPHRELYEGRGDSLQAETAADASGGTFRMNVKATTPGTNPSWVVFALRNPTNKPIERWLFADRYTMAGSGVIWPDLDARRIEAVTQSEGFVPERVRNDRADIFRIHLEKRQIDPALFDLAELAETADGFTGAEIEEAVVSARYLAGSRGEPVQQDDVLSAASKALRLKEAQAKVARDRHLARERAIADLAVQAEGGAESDDAILQAQREQRLGAADAAYLIETNAKVTEAARTRDARIQRVATATERLDPTNPEDRAASSDYWDSIADVYASDDPKAQ